MSRCGAFIVKVLYLLVDFRSWIFSRIFRDHSFWNETRFVLRRDQQTFFYRWSLKNVWRRVFWSVNPWSWSVTELSSRASGQVLGQQTKFLIISLKYNSISFLDFIFENKYRSPKVISKEELPLSRDPRTARFGDRQVRDFQTRDQPVLVRGSLLLSRTL